tara:strand:+ start:10571 stop:11782 length:1212 start_codon:yes stop_codon:yes gene_type:complete
MKTPKKNSLLLLTVLLFVLTSCSEDSGTDTTAPGPVQVKAIIPQNGGAKIVYTLPDDNDILYVKAAYKNAQGEDVFNVASASKDIIEVGGFVDTSPKKVKLSVIDDSGNQSKSEEVTVEPLESFIFLVSNSIQLQADLGGVEVQWDNDNEKTVFVYLYYNDGVEEGQRILSSNSKNEKRTVRGLQAIPYDFSVVVEDFDGNKTEKVFVSSITPKFEEKIDKSTWTVVSQLSVNGNAWEGSTVNFWDDVIDTKEINTDNSYFMINRDDNGGALNWPLDIVIDLNKNVKINRFKLWQRAFWYGGVEGVPYYYQGENIRAFDIYISNDRQEWTLAGTFDIGDPKDTNGNISDEKLQEAEDGHDFEFEKTTTPFRYLKLSITSNYGSEQYVNGSEITLYGLDNMLEE